MGESKLYEEIDKLPPEVRLKVMIMIDNGDTSLFYLKKDEILRILAREECEKKKRVLWEEAQTARVKDGVLWGEEIPGTKQVEPGLYVISYPLAEEGATPVDPVQNTAASGWSNQPSWVRWTIITGVPSILLICGLLYYFIYIKPEVPDKQNTVLSHDTIMPSDATAGMKTDELTNKIFRVKFDGNVSIGQLVAAGNYDWVDPSLWRTLDWSDSYDLRRIVWNDVRLVPLVWSDEKQDYTVKWDESFESFGANDWQILQFVSQYPLIKVSICSSWKRSGGTRDGVIWYESGKKKFGIIKPEKGMFELVIIKGSETQEYLLKDFDLEVNYSVPLKELLLSNFTSVSRDVVDMAKEDVDNKAILAKMQVRMFKNPVNQSKEDALKFLDSQGYRAANLRELIFFRLVYSTFISSEYMKLAALGTEVVYSPIFKFVPYIYSHKLENSKLYNYDLYLLRTDIDAKIDVDCYFLGVKK